MADKQRKSGTKRWILIITLSLTAIVALGVIVKPLVSKRIKNISQDKHIKAPDAGENRRRVVTGQLPTMDVAYLTKRANLIVIGKVIKKVNSGTLEAPNAPTKLDLPYTDWQVEVESWLKGDSASVIYVRLNGGTTNNLNTVVNFAARMSEGERVLLFLGRRWWMDRLLPEKTYAVNGSFMGKYALKNGRAINKDKTRSQLLDELIGDIKRYISTGESGHGPLSIKEMREKMKDTK